MDKKQVMSTLNCSVDNNLNISSDTTDSGSGTFLVGSDTSNHTCWTYYQDYYYPYVIRESYPVYLQERAKDKGKHAFEIIKILKDKKLVQLKTVGDFIDLMDSLIKIL